MAANSWPCQGQVRVRVRLHQAAPSGTRAGSAGASTIEVVGWRGASSAVLAPLKKRGAVGKECPNGLPRQGGDCAVGAKPRGLARITIAGDARRTQRTHANTVEHTNEREGEYSLRDVAACSVFD